MSLFNLSTSTTTFDNDSIITVDITLNASDATTTVDNNSRYPTRFLLLNSFSSDFHLYQDYSYNLPSTFYIEGWVHVTPKLGLFIKYNNQYYCVSRQSASDFTAESPYNYREDGLDLGETHIVYSSSGNISKYYATNIWIPYQYSTNDPYKHSVNFTVPRYIANNTNLYVAAYADVSVDCYDTNFSDIAQNFFISNYHSIYDGQDGSGSYYTRGEMNKLDGFDSYIEVKTCNRSHTMDPVSIAYPTFSSSNVDIKIPSIYNAYKMKLQRSTDGGDAWADIYTTSTGTTLDDSSTWNVSYNNYLLTSKSNSTLSYTTNVTLPIPAINYTDEGRTTDAIYRVIYTGKNNADIIVTGNTSSVLDFTASTPDGVPDVASYSNRNDDSITITNTSITDRSRISFRECFVNTSLPNTTFTAQNGVDTYNLNAIDDSKSLTTNLGNYFTLPNGTYEYRIYPMLDGQEIYVSEDNLNYIPTYYKKTTSKLEMIRPIDVGANQPKSIKLIINPAKDDIPAGSSLKFYVANNGNDENIAWEELPDTCVGSVKNGDVDDYAFMNTTKTAENWKLLIKVVADKGTATSDLYLGYITAILNGGEKAGPAYEQLDFINLDADATAIDIELPSGYKGYRIIGSIIVSGTYGNPTFKLNDVTSGYSTMVVYSSGTSTVSLKRATTTTHAGYAGYQPTANTIMYFEAEITTVVGSNPHTCQLVCTGITYNGVTYSQAGINLSTPLNKLTVYSGSTSQSFIAGSSITVMGVK